MSLVTSEEHNAFKGYLHTATSEDNMEFELRFSTYTQPDLFKENKVANGPECDFYRFVPIIDKMTFHKAMNQMKSRNLPMETRISTDWIYESPNKFETIRCCVTTEAPTSSTVPTVPQSPQILWQRKMKRKKRDLWNLGVRVSLSTEIQCDPCTSEPTMCREKYRTSFFDGYIRTDFTMVKSQDRRKVDALAREQYEIEMELVGIKNVNVGRLFEHVIHGMNDMLQLLQESSVVMTKTERHNVLLEFSVLTKKKMFIGAQPETLHRHNCHRISECAVMEKYDGERHLLFVSDNSWCYLLDRRLRMKKTDLMSLDSRGTVLDVELLGTGVHAFDILFMKGKDLRGVQTETLMPRLKKLSQIVASVQSSGRFRLFKKKVHLDKIAFEKWNHIHTKIRMLSHEEQVAKSLEVETTRAEHDRFFADLDQRRNLFI
jgi:hypothetical protein